MKSTRLKRLLVKILGRGIDRSNGDIWHKCPFCKHHKNKLSINVLNEKWHCWVCGAKGRKIYNLFKKIKVSINLIKELNEILGESYYKNFEKTKDEHVSLPLEYIPLLNGNIRSPHYKNAIHYLKKRGLSKIDILRYNIGYIEYGEYNGMIVIPSYDEDGVVNYFVSRAFYETNYKHKNPKVSKDIIGFEPLVSLKGGIDGSRVLNKVIKKSSNLIKIGGKLVLEIGYDQRFIVMNLLKKEGFYINKIIKDYSNNDRCIISTKL